MTGTRSLAVMLLVGACGGGHAAPDASTHDASRDAAPAPDAPVLCSVLAQDCPMAGKCTLAGVDDQHLAPTCEPVTGNRMTGETCTRSGGFGEDDCKPGGFCTFAGVLPPANGGDRYCRALCASDTDCASNQQCAQQAAAQSLGFCVPACTAFAACPSAMTCAETRVEVGTFGTLFLDCRVAGTTAVGSACQLDTECVADAVCIQSQCRAICDAGAHPCATGTCTMQGALGVCL